MARRKLPQCIKDSFPNRYEAEREAGRMMRRKRKVRNHVARLHAYLCHCGAWHITHTD